MVGKLLGKLTTKLLSQLSALFPVYFLYSHCYWADQWEKWKQAKQGPLQNLIWLPPHSVYNFTVIFLDTDSCELFTELSGK